MADLHKAKASAREALAKLREHDGGTRYNGDDDDVGERACCLVPSWKPHDSDCPHAVAVAEFGRLLAALDAARGEAVAWQYQRTDGTWMQFQSDKHRADTEAAGWPTRPVYAAPPAALAVPADHPALAAAREATSRHCKHATDVLRRAIDSALALRDLLAVIDSAQPAQQPTAARKGGE